MFIIIMYYYYDYDYALSKTTFVIKLILFSVCQTK